MPIALRVGAAVAALILLTGCSQVVEEAKKAMTPSIAVGQCTDLESASATASTEVSEIKSVDCAAAHTWEAYAEKNLPLADAYPGLSAIETRSEEFCVAEFATFAGLSYDDSIYEMQFLYPTEQSWALLTDRTISCLIGDPEGGVTGTLKGIQE